jgi:hypothetical protein
MSSLGQETQQALAEARQELAEAIPVAGTEGIFVVHYVVVLCGGRSWRCCSGRWKKGGLVNTVGYHKNVFPKCGVL